MDRGRKISLSLALLAACALAQFVTGYRIRMEKMEVLRDGASKEYYEWYLGRIGRFNRSSRLLTLNVNFTQIKDLPADTWVDVIAYELLATNAYSKIPVRIISGSFCDFIGKERFFFKDLLQHSNLPSECPVAKGNYYIKDYLPNEDMLPPELPGERWRLDITMKVNNQRDVIWKFSLYTYIDRYVQYKAGKKLVRV